MKKIATIAMCILMMLSMMPIFVFAADGATNVATKDEFVAAIADETAKNINITADIDMTDANVLDISGRIIDLGGHTISAKNFTLIFQGSDFTIRNGKFDSKGGSYALFIGEAPTQNVILENIKTTGGINVYNSNNVVLRDVDVTGTNYYAVWCDAGTNVTIESGTFKTSEKSIAAIGMSKNESSLNINDGNFIAGSKPLVLQGNYNVPVIHGGSFDCSAKDYLDDSLKFEVSTSGNFNYFRTIDEAIENSTPDSVIIPTDSEVDSETAFELVLVFNDGTNRTVKLLADKEGNVTLPEISMNNYGYTFVSWNDEANSYKAGTTITLTENKTLTAQWKKYVTEYIPAKAPTCVDAGNIEYWYLPEVNMYFKDEALTQKMEFSDTIVSALGHQFVNGVCSVCKKSDPDYKEYEVTHGNGSIWNKGSNIGISIGIPSEIGSVTNVTIDGVELVNGKDYSIENGIITINADVFEKLDAGQHTVIIFSENGYAETTITIANTTEMLPTDTNTDNPQTGEYINLGLLSGLLITSTISIVSTILYRKRKTEK